MSEAWKEQEGQVVDERFPLLRLLGSGEGSAVFLTQFGEPEPQRAAIKLIRADPGKAQRELARWKQVAELSHPNLVRLFHFGTCQLDGATIVYAVMEYAEEDLAGVFRERALTEVEAREMLPPVLDALAYLHNDGFVHGHLKPGNILAIGDHVKVSSDGISQTAESGITSAEDVWALGIVLVEALTQQTPVKGGPLQEPVVPETMPVVFRDIARRCLRTAPESRPTVASIAARLRGQFLPEPSAPRGVAERAAGLDSEAPPKMRYALRAAVAAVLALVAIVAVPKLLSRKTPPPVVEQSAQQPAAPPAEQSKMQAEAPPKAAEPAPVPTAAPASPIPAASPKKDNVDQKRPSAFVAPPRKAEPASRTSSASRSKNIGPSGGVAQQVLPEITRAARDTIHGMVKIGVRVNVDPAGNVASAKLDPAGPSKYFAGLTLQAARRWKFRPPQSQGQDMPSEWLLRFELTRSGTSVRPSQVAP